MKKRKSKPSEKTKKATPKKTKRDRDPKDYLNITRKRFCGNRMGREMYVASSHPSRRIRAVIEENGMPDVYDQYPKDRIRTVPPGGDVLLGCSYAPGYGTAPPVSYTWKIKSAGYV